MTSIKNKLILVGGGGHCRSVIEVIQSFNIYQIEGIIDLPEKVGQKIMGIPVIGSDTSIPGLCQRDLSFLVTVGHIKDNSLRSKLVKIVENNGGRLATVIAPTAIVAKSTTIGEGSIIMHQAFVNANSQIGKNCIINTKSLIEHDVRIGDNVHVSTGAIVNGEVNVENDCFIGSHATVIHGINIARGSIIAAGAVVIKSTRPNQMLKGIAAK